MLGKTHGSPLIIAHRGASAYLPEHTSESKALAFGQGADYIEQDIVATRDGALLVQHDIFLDYVTDVAQRYPAKRRDDGHYYTIDFTLNEVRGLRLFERLARDGNTLRYANRFPLGRGSFRIATLEEEIELIQGLNHTTGRTVGLYTEIKHPAWHAAHGIDLGARVLRTLADAGYRTASDPVYVQCFDATEIRRLRGDLGTSLKLVQLLDEEEGYAEHTTRAGLQALASVVDAVGWPIRRMLEAPAEDPSNLVASLPVRIARELGLSIHAYTFRREDLLPGMPDLEAQLRVFMSTIGVDAVFCDHPDVACKVRRDAFPRGN